MINLLWLKQPNNTECGARRPTFAKVTYFSHNIILLFVRYVNGKCSGKMYERNWDLLWQANNPRGAAAIETGAALCYNTTNDAATLR